jgi:hypothetical protein
VAAATRPSERAIGARIRVKPDHADAAAGLFAEAGFEPLNVEHRADGDVSFWFARMEPQAQWRLITAIPRDFYALQAVGVSALSREPR